MNAERLLQHYEQINDAPDAIARLRRFILDLAVRGKLVPQDSGDEPASELLQRIESGRAQSRAKQAPVGSGEAAPFDLPAGWVWSTIGSICSKTGSGSTPRGGKEVYVDRGIPFLRSQNVYDDGLRLSDVAYIAPAVHARMSGTAVKPSDLLLNITGGSMGRCSLVPELFGEANISQHVAIIRLVLTSMSDFIHRLVLSPYFQAFIFNEQTGAGRGGLPKNRMDQIAVALPPLAEQHRIVAKVDELMALCDELEAARAERETKRDQLAAASLARLNAPDAETFRDDARFALDALPALTARPDQIKQLRQTILNLAVRGKLVPQDPTDEPAEGLLKKQFKLPKGYLRRRKIVKEASVDASKGLLAPIPRSWAYALIQDLYDANIVIDYADGNHGSLYPRSSEFGTLGVTFVSAKDLVDGRVVWDSCSKLNENRARQLTKGWAQAGDILLTHNATVGRVARVDEEVEPFLLGTSVTFYRLNEYALLRKYFYVVLLSPVWQGQLEAIMAQTTRNQVSIQKQASFKIPLPPLAEQHRIVAKVDELMALCDQLETSVTHADETRKKLLDALLAEALAPVDADALREAAE